MQKAVIRPRTLAALDRVEVFVLANPHSDWQQISAGLGIKKTTLNSYTLALRHMGRMSKTAHCSRGRAGALPDTFQVLPDLPPLSGAVLRPAPVLPPPPAAPARRMDLVACLFGETGMAGGAA